MVFKITNYIRKGFFFYILKAIIYKIPASPRIDARTEETMSGKVNLHMHASVVSSKTILKLPLGGVIFYE
ncbi:MAG: hypothetical protein EWM46_11110 [Fermentimonas caenicola]|nr:MAG: hypothetical protein EWM46_11110 [Fermentimonas caenicola]